MSANQEQVRYWNEEGADQWVTRQDLLDTMLAVFLPPLLAAVAASPGDHVLDVGCGSGATTLELAGLVGPAGRVMGLDVSRPLLDRLQERAGSRGSPTCWCGRPMRRWRRCRPATSTSSPRGSV